MKITRLHSMLPAGANAFGQRVVAADHHSGIARRAEIFRRIEAETTDLAHRAGFRWSPAEGIFRSNRLGRVLNHVHLKALGNAMDGIHVTAQTVEMDGNDRAHISALWVAQFAVASALA